jgi:hypothetical protein
VLCIWRRRGRAREFLGRCCQYNFPHEKWRDLVKDDNLSRGYSRQKFGRWDIHHVTIKIQTPLVVAQRALLSHQARSFRPRHFCVPPCFSLFPQPLFRSKDHHAHVLASPRCTHFQMDLERGHWSTCTPYSVHLGSPSLSSVHST